MKVLDLFSGTQSLKKELGDSFEVVCVDINAKSKPDICADLRTWDYTQLVPGDFDVVWASPPCTEYSIAKTTGMRDIAGANALVQRVFDIIRYLNPRVWIMENPQTGKLKDQEFMKDLPYYDVSYCKYGFKYRKQTRLWTNLEGFQPRVCRQDCEHLVENPLTGRLWHVVNFGSPKMRGHHVPLRERYSVPPELIQDITRLL